MAEPELSGQHAAGACELAERAWMAPTGCKMAADWPRARRRSLPLQHCSGAPAESGRTARMHRGSPESWAPAEHQTNVAMPLDPGH